MHRRAARTWLHLMLAILMVIGPWPVFAGSATGDGCCATAMEVAAGGQHRSCGSSEGQGSCCSDQGCPAAHCAAAVFLPSHVENAFSAFTNHSPSASDRSPPTDALAPPTPPPISLPAS